MSRRFWLGLAMLAGLAPAVFAHTVQTSDPAVARQILASGGRLIADYGGYQLLESARAGGVIVRDKYNSVLLRRGRMTENSPVVSGNRLQVVQFAGPILPAWRAALLAAGLRIVEYIPYNAYLVYGGAAAVNAFAATNAAVRAHGLYAALAPVPAPAPRYVIQLVADPAANAQTLQPLPVERQWRVRQYLNARAEISPAQLPLVAARPDVISIQPVSTPRQLGERQDQIVAGNLSGTAPSGPGYLAWLAGKGFAQAQFDASGFVVDISDSGIDNGTPSPNHFGLYPDGNTNAASHVVYSRLEGTPNTGSTLAGCDGHGTLNAHLVTGFDDGAGAPFADGAGFHYGLGVCPFVRVGASVIFDPFEWTSPTNSTVISDAYASGARISNNSWGFEGVFGEYDATAQEFDALVRDAQTNSPGNQEMVIVFADGDSGPGAETVLSPSTAKNVISVGGAQNVQIFEGSDACGIGDDQADDADAIATGSSRGPCADGRHKPDLVAPSTHVSGGVIQAADPGPDGTADPCYLAAWSSGNESVCGGVDNDFFPAGQEFYTASSGTSVAAPCVSGACALVRQYFINQSLAPPSPAMTKAYLMNSARYLGGDSLWSDAQGMGEVDLGAAFDGSPRVLRDELPFDMFNASGQSRTIGGEVAGTNTPLRVTLAWTDAPGSTTGAAWNNDLDLSVTVGGRTYLGNVFSGGWSVPGGSPDDANNVESVFLPAGVSGAFQVTIMAANINSPGVPNPGDAPLQDFAVVIGNAIAFPVLSQPQAAGSNFVFSIQTQPNQSYTVQSAAALPSLVWQPVETISGTGGLVWITNALTPGQAYYRAVTP